MKASVATEGNRGNMNFQFANAIVVLCLCFASALTPSAGQAATDKVALVIGIGEYAHAPRLPNPVNDAALVGRTLESMGFDVSTELDLSKPEFEDVLSAFAEKSRTANISLIYYAGHGIQVAGKVYLVPADSKVSTGRDLRNLIDAEYLLEDAALARQLSVVILDACRDSPFTRSLAEDFGPSRSAALGRGLSRIDEVPRNTLIAYATSAGNIALDGDGANSPFAIALAESLGVPGRDVRIAFGAVRDRVLELTRHRQEPFIYGSLGGSAMYLAGPAAAAGKKGRSEPNPRPPAARPEHVPVDPSSDIADLMAISGDYASWAAIARSGSWTKLTRLQTLVPDSYYSILASSLLSDRRAHPTSNLGSAFERLDDRRFEPRALRRAWIVEIQKKLAAAGFYGGEFDGVWGQQSERALAAFAGPQGKLGYKTYGMLRRLGEYADSQDVTGHLSGRWAGRYFYRRPVNGVTDVPFEMNLVMSQSRIAGSVVEPNTFGDGTSKNLYADFDGRIIGDRVLWTKQYDGTAGVNHAVQYEGVLDRSANRISGEWTIGESVGDFHIELER